MWWSCVHVPSIPAYIEVLLVPAVESSMRSCLLFFLLLCREPTLTTRTSSYSDCLDYIWLSKQHFHVSETLAMPYPDPDLESKESPDVLVSTSVFGPCPNDVFPSDHLAVGCDAVLLPASVKAADLVALSTTGSSNSRV